MIEQNNMEKQCSICGALNPQKKIVERETLTTDYKTVVSIEVRRYKREIIDGEQYESKVPERLELCETCLNNLLDNQTIVD